MNKKLQISYLPNSINGIDDIINNPRYATTIGLINYVINENDDKVKEYKAGKEKLFGFFVGQVMKISSGKANPKLINEILKDKLSKRQKV